MYVCTCMCVRACVYVHVCYCIVSWPDSHLDVVMRTLRVTQVKCHNRPEASDTTYILTYIL